MQGSHVVVCVGMSEKEENDVKMSRNSANCSGTVREECHQMHGCKECGLTSLVDSVRASSAPALCPSGTGSR
jgi:hypothetical protein